MNSGDWDGSAMVGGVSMANAWVSTRRGMVIWMLVLMWYPCTWAMAQPQLQPGMMLVANSEIKHGVFARSVILLIEHNERGSIGVVVNKPREQSLGNLAQRLKPTRYAQDKLFYGGPQQRNAVLTLIRTQRSHPNMRRVMDDVYAVAGVRAMIHIAEQAEPEEQLRVYAGYAGWAPGQLQKELARGAWQLVPADAETVFGTMGDLWERLSGGQMRWVGVPPSMTDLPYWVQWRQC